MPFLIVHPRNILNSQHQPRKRFGQHFLHDQATIERILAAINAQPGQHIIEIGPGKGVLTISLLERVGEMDVVELDRDLVNYLTTRCQETGTLRIHSADVLKFDFSQFPADLRIVGNLPYNISTPLLFHLLDYKDHIKDMLFMLQREVVERICSAPGSRSYGRLSVMLQYHYEVDQLFTIGPYAFSPVPRIESTMIRLRPWSEPRYQQTDMKVFSRIVKTAFAQRRKTLRNALKGIVSASQLREINIAPSSRAEILPIEAYVLLTNLVCNNKNQ
jgi:16S rRNA (adenine1518-N6/adenine1519-N6)-dimethyltransferase